MSIEHAAIPDIHLHEPKGVASAVANTVYGANGAGTGSWRKVDSLILSGLSGDGFSSNKRLVTNGANGFQLKEDAAYGSMLLSNSSASFLVTPTGDPTMNSFDDYKLLTGVPFPFVSGPNMFGVGFNTDRLTIGTTGVYQLNLNVQNTTAPIPPGEGEDPEEIIMAIRYRINGVTYSPHKILYFSRGMASLNETIALNNGDYIQVMVATYNMNFVVISDVSLNLTLIRNTA